MARPAPPPPPLTRERFGARLAAGGWRSLSPAVVEALHAHYLELLRWNRLVSLIGPGTEGELVERHYGESLAALPWLDEREGPLELVDVGSGAGFPGFVLAAARPAARVTLVEAREKKWAFLESARRKAGLSCRVLNARVSRPLPPEWPAQVDVLTSRALRLDRELLEELAGRMSPDGSFWLWAGEAPPELPEGWCVAREQPLPGGTRRRLLEARRAERI